MSHHPELWKTIRWLALLSAVVALGFFTVGFFERSAKGTSHSIERGLDKVLGALTNSNTRIVEGRAEITGETEITELSLLELRMSATRSFENDTYILRYLPGGTKQLIVHGDYSIKAGYRLEPGVSLQVENGIPVARFPKSEILSVELNDFRILSEKDGWANDVTPEDRATLLRELKQQMRVEAEKSGVLDLVDATLRTRMKDLIGTDQVRIERKPEP